MYHGAAPVNRVGGRSIQGSQAAMNLPVFDINILNVFKLVGVFFMWLVCFSPVIGLILYYVMSSPTGGDL